MELLHDRISAWWIRDPTDDQAVAARLRSMTCSPYQGASRLLVRPIPQAIRCPVAGRFPRVPVHLHWMCSFCMLFPIHSRLTRQQGEDSGTYPLTASDRDGGN